MIRQLGDSAWRLTARAIGGVSRRLAELEFDDVMALGCGLVHRGPALANTLSLTFDDGPHPTSTVGLLDVLDEHGFKATFFCLGENARRWPELVHEIARRGHEVASHGVSHPDMHRVAPWVMWNELSDGKQILEDITGSPVVCFRAPYGHFRWDMKPFASRVGFRHLVGWDVSPAYDEPDARALANYVESRISPGSIVCLHEPGDPGQPDTLAHPAKVALAQLLPQLRERGYGSWTVEALLAQ